MTGPEALSVVAEPGLGRRGCPGEFEQGGMIGGRPGKPGELYQVRSRLVLNVREGIPQAIAQLAKGAGLDGPSLRHGTEAIVRPSR
jgi:hypothetical protein